MVFVKNCGVSTEVRTYFSFDVIENSFEINSLKRHSLIRLIQILKNSNALDSRVISVISRVICVL